MFSGRISAIVRIVFILVHRPANGEYGFFFDGLPEPLFNGVEQFVFLAFNMF